MTYKITPWLEITDEDLDDHVLGSGALSYPWYWDIDGSAEETGGWTFTVEDPETDDSLVKTITAEDFVKAMRKIARADRLHATGSSQTIKDQILHDDLDADGVDCILQTALFGEVVYG